MLRVCQCFSCLFRVRIWTRITDTPSDGTSLKPDVRELGKRNRRDASGDFAQAENAHRSLLFADRRKKTNDLSLFPLALRARRLSDGFHHWRNPAPAQTERKRPCLTHSNPLPNSVSIRLQPRSGLTRKTARPGIRPQSSAGTRTSPALGEAVILSSPAICSWSPRSLTRRTAKSKSSKPQSANTRRLTKTNSLRCRPLEPRFWRVVLSSKYRRHLTVILSFLLPCRHRSRAESYKLSTGMYRQSRSMRLVLTADRRSACGTPISLAAELILRFSQQQKRRKVQIDKLCVCRTAQPTAARPQTRLQGGAAPVDPRKGPRRGASYERTSSIQGQAEWKQ